MSANRILRLSAVVVMAVIPLAAPVLASSPGPSASGRPSGPVFTVDAFEPGAPIDNAYFPLPVGRALVFTVRRDGETLRDTVVVTDRTRLILGVSATVVTDVAERHGSVRERTEDWYAQDIQGNVWYLGEDTVAFDADGTADTSGSWEAGVDGAVPGIIMEATPGIPDGYRQEYLAGEAEDTAWVVATEGSVEVPYGTIDHVLTTLEATRLEPGVYSEKVYGPGLGIVFERGIAGEDEVARLVSVTDQGR